MAKGKGGIAQDEEKPAVDSASERDETVLEPEADESIVLVDDAPAGGTDGDDTPAEESPGTRSREDRGDGRGTEKKGDPRAALKQQRVKARERERSLLEELDREKAARAEAERKAGEEKVRADREAERAARFKKLDEFEGDLSEAAKTVHEAVIQDTEVAIDERFVRMRVDHLALSQELMRDRLGDKFDQVLEESGIADAITWDPQKKTWNDPVVGRRLIMDEPNPARAAYDLGLEILERRGKGAAAATDRRAPGREPDDEGMEVLDENRGDRASGRREVIERLERVASRPQGVRHLTPRNGSEPRRLSRADIDQMNDEEYARLPKHVRDEYLRGRG